MKSRAFWCIFLLAFLSACSDSHRSADTANANNPSSPPSIEKKPFKIALVLKTLTNPFFMEIEKGARRAEKEFGVDLQVKTGSQETAVEQQIQFVEALIEAKVDALVISPGDSKRLIPVLKKAQKSGMVIINIDNSLDSENILPLRTAFLWGDYP